MKNHPHPFWSHPLAERLGIIATILVLLILVSCSPKPPETITIRGSNTFGEELAPKLIDEYKKDHPQISFNTEFKGTSYGFGALMVDRCDIGAASREETTNEVE